MPAVLERESPADESARAPRSRPLSGEHRHREHAERKRRHRQAGLQRVVFERHLQEDRQRDDRAAHGDLLQHLLGGADPEVREPEQVRVEEGRLGFALLSHEPVGQRSERDRTDRDEQPDQLAAFLPHQNAEDDATHADHGEDRTDPVDLARSGVGHVADKFDPGEHHHDDDGLEENRPATTGRW